MIIMNYLAFDLGATIIKFAIINEDYEIITKASVPAPKDSGRDEIINIIFATISQFSHYHLQGIAISSPGIIDSDHGIVLYANERIPNYTNTKLQEIITGKTGLSCSVENDVNCFALSEIRNGHRSFLMITIGSGIGGAIVIDKEIYHGHHFSAGEFGQMRLHGQKWEDLASVKSLCERAAYNGLPVEGGRELFTLFDHGDSTAALLIDEFYDNLAVGICNLAYIFNPETIIIGGGITERKQFLPELQSKIQEIADDHYFGNTTIQISDTNNEGGLIGAVIHFQNMQKKKRFS